MWINGFTENAHIFINEGINYYTNLNLNSFMVYFIKCNGDGILFIWFKLNINIDLIISKI